MFLVYGDTKYPRALLLLRRFCPSEGICVMKNNVITVTDFRGKRHSLVGIVLAS